MTPLVSEEAIACQTPGAQAIIRLLLAEIERLRTEGSRLHAEGLRWHAEVARLRTEVAAGKLNPRNSSQPPSTQHPHAKPPAHKPKSRRKRGGQPGHPKFERALVPVEQCAAVHDHRPQEMPQLRRQIVGHGLRATAAAGVGTA